METGQYVRRAAVLPTWLSCVQPEKERSRPRGVEREVMKGMMRRSGVSNGGGSVAWRITDDIGRRFSMRTPDNPPPVHLQRISILIPDQHLVGQRTREFEVRTSIRFGPAADPNSDPHSGTLRSADS